MLLGCNKLADLSSEQISTNVFVLLSNGDSAAFRGLVVLRGTLDVLVPSECSS